MISRTVSVVFGLFLAVALVALAAPASAEMYVEGYLGGTAASNLGQAFSTHEAVPINGIAPEDSHLHFSGTPEATVLGGLKLGTWFVKGGFAGYSGYPDWMKYFGFYTDLSFQRLELRASLNGTNTFKFTSPADPSFVGLNSGEFFGDGTIVTWAFMFAARYGFYSDAEVPFGRLQPYVAVGPAIMFSSLEGKCTTTWAPSVAPGQSASNMSGGTQGSVNIALQAETGIRYMCTKNISVDLSFKYRYAQPSYTYSGADADGAGGIANPATFKLNPVYQLFSGQLGVAYHF